MLLKRSATIVFSGLVIFTSMASCSLPGFNSSNDENTTFGVLKRDPSIVIDGVAYTGFGSATDVITASGGFVENGLDGLSTKNIIQNGYNSYFILTDEKGVFHTQNGGQTWSRKYVIEPESYTFLDGKRIQKSENDLIFEKIKLNDALKVTAMSSDVANNILYIAIKQDNKAKIFSSNDNGDSFKELYNGVSDEDINFIANNPNLANTIYASFTNNSVIQTTDQGQTWQKVDSLNDDIVQLGYSQDKLFAVLEDNGIAYYSNNIWTEQTLRTQSDKKIKNIQHLDIFSTTDSNNPSVYLLVADKKVWIAKNQDLKFNPIDLPLSSDKINISTVEAVFNKESNNFSQIWVAADSSIYKTENEGVSWKTNDQLGLDGSIGNISDFIIDKDDSEVYYITLSKEVKSTFGFWR